MIKFVTAKTKTDVTSQYGFDWAKIVKVDGGYMLFDTITAYKTWVAQK